MTKTSMDKRRLINLLGMLGSDFDGERANVGKMANSMVRDAGLTWQDVILLPSERPTAVPSNDNAITHINLSEASSVAMVCVLLGRLRRGIGYTLKLSPILLLVLPLLDIAGVIPPPPPQHTESVPPAVPRTLSYDDQWSKLSDTGNRVPVGAVVSNWLCTVDYVNRYYLGCTYYYGAESVMYTLKVKLKNPQMLKPGMMIRFDAKATNVPGVFMPSSIRIKE